MKNLAHVLMPVLVLGFGTFMPLAANADTSCCDANTCYTCTASQTCNYDIDGNAYCAANTTTSTGGSSANTTSNTGGSSGGASGNLFNPLGPVKLWDLMLKILDFVIEVGAVVVVFMMVYVGFLFVVGASEPAKLSRARDALLWTIVGALILLGAKAITLGVCETVKALSTDSAITTCPVL